jgi:metallo-beta-lactamase family protein
MPENDLKLTFYGGTEAVTGVNLLLETAGSTGKPTRILLDCGLLQGENIHDLRNLEPFSYDVSTIDALFVSHAHIDHTGRIPKMVKDGFRGKIYSTPPTKDIAEVLLLDSLGIMTKQAKAQNVPVFYSEEDVRKSMDIWQTVDYYKPVTVGDLSVTFRNAGHVLGSAMTEVLYKGEKLLYTSDLGNSPAPFLPDTDTVNDITYLLIESVYGDRNHEHRAERENILEDVIEDTVSRGGTLVVPTFSFERTQEFLFEVRNMMAGSKIPLIKVFLDSPLAIEVTKVYEKYLNYYKQGNDGKPPHDIFGFPQLHFSKTTEESKAIHDYKAPKIIIAGSGMSNGGRVVHHEKMFLPESKNTLLLLGYQAPGTLGRQLQDGAKTVRIFGEEVPVRARVVTIGGYSAHKDSDHLLEFVENTSDTLKKIFVILGEPKASLFLIQKIRDYMGLDARMPHKGETVELNFNNK